MTMQLAAFGCGYVASELARRIVSKGGQALGTTRAESSAGALKEQGIEPVIWPGHPFTPPNRAIWLISVPPDAAGCPVYRSFKEYAVTARWIGYLSTTGVYGDLNGGWAFEWSPPHPESPEAANRARAEEDWLSVGAHIFRLPGIYGPKRSQLDRVQAPNARRIHKPGQVFSRAHRDDIAGAIEASINQPSPGRIYNVCDDEPAPADVVLSYAAAILGIEPPPEVNFDQANLSPAAQRFYNECKRVSNARIKAELGWRPQYPTYREGLRACYEVAERSI